jgi:hypothetical protein
MGQSKGIILSNRGLTLELKVPPLERPRPPVAPPACDPDRVDPAFAAGGCRVGREHGGWCRRRAKGDPAERQLETPVRSRLRGLGHALNPWRLRNAILPIRRPCHCRSYANVNCLAMLSCRRRLPNRCSVTQTPVSLRPAGLAPVTDISPTATGVCRLSGCHRHLVNMVARSVQICADKIIRLDLEFVLRPRADLRADVRRRELNTRNFPQSETINDDCVAAPAARQAP